MCNEPAEPETSKGEGRIYDKGRSTLGWKRGERITSASHLKAGLVVITLNHRFEAENLVVVTQEAGSGQFAKTKYCNPRKDLIGGEDAVVLDAYFLPGHASVEEYFYAVKEVSLESGN